MREVEELGMATLERMEVAGKANWKTHEREWLTAIDQFDLTPLFGGVSRWAGCQSWSLLRRGDLLS